VNRAVITTEIGVSPPTGDDEDQARGLADSLFIRKRLGAAAERDFEDAYRRAILDLLRSRTPSRNRRAAGSSESTRMESHPA
jgi:hypothetical protein